MLIPMANAIELSGLVGSSASEDGGEMLLHSGLEQSHAATSAV